MESAATSASDDLVGRVLLGKLEVIRKLGGGGMGVVYEVAHRLTGHRRALKVVHSKYADRPRFMKRLLREARVAGTLNTPYVVETYDAGRLEDGSAYVLMELLQGRTLHELIQTEGALAPRRVAALMSQVAEGIALAHAAGIIHRDLKPENLFVVADEDGERVKILDFGVSKFEETPEGPTRLTAEGTLLGTPYYMSPEQAAGLPIDGRADVYAMGVVLYEALTGRLPFEAESMSALFVKIGAGECIPLRTRRPDLEPAWHELVHRAFHRQPDHRIPSAEALRRELLALEDGPPSAARAELFSESGPVALPTPTPPRRLAPLRWALSAIALTLLLGLAWHLTRDPPWRALTATSAPSVANRLTSTEPTVADRLIPAEPTAAEPPAPSRATRAASVTDAPADAGTRGPPSPRPPPRPRGPRTPALDPNPYR